jgi:hypothetical protein
VREQLRLALAGVKDLIRALKAEKRNQKSLKLALTRSSSSTTPPR